MTDQAITSFLDSLDIAPRYRAPAWLIRKLLGHRRAATGVVQLGTTGLVIVESEPDSFVRSVGGGATAVLRSYAKGEWDTDDLFGVMQCLHKLDEGLEPLHVLRSLLPRRRAKTSQHDTALHYDLPVSLFRAFTFDLNYSVGALRASPEDPARAHSLHLAAILAALKLPASGLILDLGGGWGNLARHVVRHTDHRIVNITISSAQAKEFRFVTDENPRAEARLGDFLDFGLWPEDVDGIVLLESIEHLTHRRRRELLRGLARAYPRSRVVLQFSARRGLIGRVRNRARGALFGVVFPGPGDLPLLSSIQRISHRAGYRVGRVLDLSAEYSWLTLTWGQRLRASEVDEIPVELKRMMLAYLAGAAAAFATSSAFCYQVLLIPAAEHRE